MNTIVLDNQRETLLMQIGQIGKQLPWLFRTYVTSFFPMFQWIGRYNLSWLLQDMIAGITVGIVLVPQSMAYAKIAGLEPQYGLYTSFVGVSVYFIFGTSKDISIGMISTVSLLVGQAIVNVKTLYPEITGPQVAVTLSLMSGVITILLGICRLGILVDFIPQPVIAGYMTGSAITIAMGQWPKLFGLSQVNTHNPPYVIFVDFFKNIGLTHLDVAFGLTGLVLLYLIRFGCQYLSCRKGLSLRQQRCAFYFGIMRNGLVVIVGTLISFGINRGLETSIISIIQNVPAGFDALALPILDSRIIVASSSVLPSIVLIMILEHVSVAKSFGNEYDYTIDPNQEIFAIGISNIVGSFFGGAPGTGAFSRTAIMAKSGVRTPMGGVWSGVVVLLALFVLTPCFYYIPDAILSAVVIHAVADLVTRPAYLKQLFHTNPLDCLVWVSAVAVTICLDVQTGVYVAVGLSLTIMLFRLARPPVKILAPIPLSLSPAACVTHHQQGDNENENGERQLLLDGQQHHRQRYIYMDERDFKCDQHYDPLPPGLLVFQLTESMLYPNAGFVSEAIMTSVRSRTRCGNTAEMEKSPHQTPWNQAVNKNTETHRLQQPVLRALIFDFTAVRQLDSTALHVLVNLQSNVNKYSGQIVEWHFVGIQSKELRWDLIHHGFTLEHHTLDEKSQQSQQQRHYQQLVMHLDEDLELALEQPHENGGSERNFNGKMKQSNLEASVFNKSSQDKYLCFHWDVDSAVYSISKRWSSTNYANNIY
ncbi:unnamed protein product [Absidia cylindrospora]